MKKIGIIGAGKMGAGIAYILSHYKGTAVKIWDRTPTVLKTIQETKESPYLPGIKLETVVPVFNLAEAIKGTDLVALAVPSFAVRQMCERLAAFKESLPPLLMMSKGFEKETAKLPFQIVQEVLGKNDILHISGIGYPKELANPREVTEGIAATSQDLLDEFGGLLETNFIKFERTTDLLGAQLGALKNVLTIAIGMATAKEQDKKAKAQLISQFIPLGVGEMMKLGEAMGAKEETFHGPFGEGDLRLSADPLSRNFRLGQDLFEKGLEEVRAELRRTKRTVEGVLSAAAAHQLAQKHGLNLPIVEAVYKVIYQGGDARKIAEELLTLVNSAAR